MSVVYWKKREADAQRVGILYGSTIKELVMKRKDSHQTIKFMIFDTPNFFIA